MSVKRLDDVVDQDGQMGDIIEFIFLRIIGTLLIGIGRRLLRLFGIEAGQVASLYAGLFLSILIAAALLLLGKLFWAH